MKQTLENFAFLVFLFLSLSLVSCRMSTGTTSGTAEGDEQESSETTKKESRDHGGDSNSEEGRDTTSEPPTPPQPEDTPWEFGQTVSFQIWQPDFPAKTGAMGTYTSKSNVDEKKGWREFVIQEGRSPTQRSFLKGLTASWVWDSSDKKENIWFVRQSRVDTNGKSNYDSDAEYSESDAKKSIYFDFEAVKVGDTESDEIISVEDKFYLRSKTHCENTKHCFLKRDYWGETNKQIKFISFENNEDLDIKSSEERLTFFIEKNQGDTVSLGESQVRLCTMIKTSSKKSEEKYCLGSYSREDNSKRTILPNADPIVFYRRIALVHDDVHKRSKHATEKEYQKGWRSPEKKGENYAYNIKVSHCDENCLKRNRIRFAPEGQRICLPPEKSLYEGAGFCTEGLHTMAQTYAKTFLALESAKTISQALGFALNVFGVPGVPLLLKGGEIMTNKVAPRKEKGRMALRFLYGTCHAFCYAKPADGMVDKHFEQSKKTFYREMGGLAMSGATLLVKEEEEEEGQSAVWKMKDETEKGLFDEIANESITFVTEKLPSSFRSRIHELCDSEHFKSHVEEIPNLKKACALFKPAGP